MINKCPVFVSERCGSGIVSVGAQQEKGFGSVWTSVTVNGELPHCETKRYDDEQRTDTEQRNVHENLAREK